MKIFCLASVFFKGLSSVVGLQLIKDITPLSPLAVDAQQHVPVALKAALFGPNDAGASGDNTFVLLDGASIDGLPEMLRASGLEYECLFKGQAAIELQDVAPWLVKIDRDSRFTHRLFTESKSPWHMWSKVACVFLRYNGTCEALGRHLRFFTRIADEAGTWRYFRFWEHQAMAVLLQNPEESLSARFLSPISSVITVLPRHGEALHFTHVCAPDAKRNDRIVLSARFWGLLEAAEADRFDERLRRHLSRKSLEFGRQSVEIQHAQTKEAVATGQFYGLRIEAALAHFAAIYVTTPRAYFTTERVRQILTAKRHELDRVKELGRYLKG